MSASDSLTEIVDRCTEGAARFIDDMQEGTFKQALFRISSALILLHVANVAT